MFQRLRNDGTGSSGLESLPPGNRGRRTSAAAAAALGAGGTPYRFVACPVRRFGSPVEKRFSPSCRIAGTAAPPAASATAATSPAGDNRNAARLQVEELARRALRPLPVGGRAQPAAAAAAAGAAAGASSKPLALVEIESYVERELKLLQDAAGGGAPTAEAAYERLNVHRSAFQMFAATGHVYAPVLARVVAEYEGFVRLLEGRLQTPGKIRQGVYKQFEAEVESVKSHVRHVLAAREEELDRRVRAFEKREGDVQTKMDRLAAENDRLTAEINRLHEQNLTLAHTVVDYRCQNEGVEKELREAEHRERRFRKLQAEHQDLLESIAQGPAAAAAPGSSGGGGSNPALVRTPPSNPHDAEQQQPQAASAPAGDPVGVT